MSFRVLMFGWELPPYNSGGLGTACNGLIKSLASNGVDITFVLPRKLDIKPEVAGVTFLDFLDIDDSANKISMKAVNSLITAYISSDEYKLRRQKLGKNGNNSIYGEDLFAEVLRFANLGGLIAKNGSFDVVHVHDWLTFKAGIEAKKVLNIPFVAHIHSTEFDRTGGNHINQFIYDIEKEGMEQADKIIAVSGFTKNIITKNYKINPDKISVIHNGIEMEDISEENFDKEKLHKFKQMGYKIVLFVGRQTIQKGPDYFLQAAVQVLRYNQKVIFVMVGSGDMQHQLVAMAAAMGISDKVMFTGFLRNEELTRVYRMADLMVMPSVSEPFGITALESLANNTPVLVSKQSGVSEVLKHVLKVDFWDLEEMVSKILAVLSYDCLRFTLAKNGRNEISDKTWCEAAKKCMHVYQDSLGGYSKKNLSL